AAGLHARPHLYSARHEGCRILRSAGEAIALCDRLRHKRRQARYGPRERPARPRLHEAAHDALGRWRFGVNWGGLLPLRADAWQWWRTGWHADFSSVEREADGLKSPAGRGDQWKLRDRHA